MFTPFPHSRRSFRHAPLLLGAAAALLFGLAPGAKAQETVGGGTLASPAQGPAPAFLPPDLSASAVTLVKNWHFGTNGTIKNQADLNANFQYHDQHNNVANGGNAYGALTVAPDDANAIFPGDFYYYDDDGTHTGRGLGTGQPIEGRDSAPVRQFTADSIKTFLVPLSHASTLVNRVLSVKGERHEVGNGSFMPKWFLPAGGSLLGQDIVWETKVRYKTPPYFWFSLWIDGDRWRWDNGSRGAEIDLIEAYGEDYLSGGAGTAYGNTNFDGHLWHANAVAGSDTVDYFSGPWWGGGMASVGINSYDATQYHIWTLVYKHDNSYAMYVDGKMVQNGTNYFWTFGNRETDSPINMDFRFDGSWGHIAVSSVNKEMPASSLIGTYYEYEYSHVYLGAPFPFSNAATSLPGTIKAVNYESGGPGVAYNQTVNGSQTLYRPDNSGADYGTAIGWTAAGQWYKYKVNIAVAGTYNFSFQAGSSSGGTFHVEDETGRNLTGTVTAPNTGGTQTYGLAVSAVSASLSAGPHVLKWVQDSGGYDLYSMTVSAAQAPYNGPHTLPGTVNATDYDTGGTGFAFNQTVSGGQTGYRADNSSADYGTGLGWTAAGQWYKYTVNATAASGSYTVSFGVGSPGGGGTFHLEDETGRNLTGTMTVPNTGGYSTVGTVTASAPVTLANGTHILKWVQDSGGYDLFSMSWSANAAAAAAAATFVKTDTATQGTWKGVYGADGYTVVNDSSVAPPYGTATASGGWTYSWAGSTADVRGLQKAGSGIDRIGAQWGGNPSFDVDCNLTGTALHQVALYGLDWDSGNRNEVIQVLDAVSGTLLDTRTLASFVGGTYLVWNVQGHVRFHVTNNGGSNASLSGMFFGPVTAAGPGALVTGTEFDDGAGPYGGNAANAAPNVFDGDPNTFYDCANGTGYVGIDAGIATPVSKIVFAPRIYLETRMLGGVFEGSNTSATAGYTTLATVTAQPTDGLTNTLKVTNTTAYRWLRYRDGGSGLCNVAEVQFIDPPTGVPSVPTGLTAVSGAVGTKKITLTWAAAAGATSYHVLRSTTSGYTGTKALAVNVTGTSYVNTGLTAGQTYYYKITAVNSKGASIASAQVSAAAK